MLLIRLRWQSDSPHKVEMSINPFDKTGKTTTLTLPSSLNLPKINKTTEEKPKLEPDKEITGIAVNTADSEHTQKMEAGVSTNLPRADADMSYTGRILAQFGGLESNIPINHPYWRQRKAKNRKTT